MLPLNVISLSRNFEFLKERLTTIKFEFQVICLTETQCTNYPRNETLFNLESYTAINQVRKHGRGDGICIFIRNSQTFKLRSNLGTNSNDIESLTIEIIKQLKMSLVHSIDNQPVILNNIKHILKISLIKWKILMRKYI